MWLKILHAIGLTNLSDEQVREYEARALQATSDPKPLEEKVVTKPKEDSSVVGEISSEKNIKNNE